MTPVSAVSPDQNRQKSQRFRQESSKIGTESAKIDTLPDGGNRTESVAGAKEGCEELPPVSPEQKKAASHYYSMLCDGAFRLRHQGATIIRHGLFTKAMRFESLRELRAYKRLCAELRRDLHPQGLIEEMHVEKMGLTLWRMRKALKAERDGKELSKRAWAEMAALDRQFHRADAALQRAQGVRAAIRNNRLSHDMLEYYRKRRVPPPRPQYEVLEEER